MKRRVAVTGIGCVSPAGIGLEAFWEAISRRESGITKISRFDASTYEVQLAGEITQPVPFPQQFSDCVAEDSKIAFALNATKQAMDDAGLQSVNSATLIHVGTSLENFDPRKIVQDGNVNLTAIVERSLSGRQRPLQMPLDTTCELIESLYGTAGLKLTNVSACAASTQAIGHAFQRVRDGSFDMALCGGFDSMINPLGVGGFQILGALSTDNERGPGACRPFDASRSGAVLGEGAAMFVLEPLQNALPAGKKIYAEVIGYGSSLDAYSLSAPDADGKGAALALRRALNDACLEAEHIHAVSAHGTGTLLNDKVEAKVIREVLGDCYQHTPVISTKSLIGHLIGAAGAVELAASIQGFVQNRLHPHGSLGRVAKGCELDHVVGRPRNFEGRYIMKNSFGFGGQNAALIIGRVDNV